MPYWDLFSYSPRWIEVSGLPGKLARDLGGAAWVLFKKLTEVDCEGNLIPDWFSVDLEGLSLWTGLGRDELDNLADRLEEKGYIEVQRLGGSWRARIRVPLPVPASREVIRIQLRKLGLTAEKMSLRYLEPLEIGEKYTQVLGLYQNVFGTRMNSQIADELREITESFEWTAIEETFREAKRQRKIGFNWVLSRLYREVYDEQLSENLGDPARSSLPSGYELSE